METTAKQGRRRHRGNSERRVPFRPPPHHQGWTVNMVNWKQQHRRHYSRRQRPSTFDGCHRWFRMEIVHEHARGVGRHPRTTVVSKTRLALRQTMKSRAGCTYYRWKLRSESVTEGHRRTRWKRMLRLNGKKQRRTVMYPGSRIAPRIEVPKERRHPTGRRHRARLWTPRGLHGDARGCLPRQTATARALPYAKPTLTVDLKDLRVRAGTCT